MVKWTEEAEKKLLNLRDIFWGDTTTKGEPPKGAE